ncbi:MAG: hypothetical protein K6C05_04245 [Anaerovibrio sp.]|uniref:hypothetical protein n=1 Tax=Anaerovibrio sp. TaxID=1872532 RepID=UPI0025E2EFD7|nr:hypothetical protein [Anaerovibrio sp.]MCR5176039.1 hypothetical protein [Anaerovibrio sp.]
MEDFSSKEEKFEQWRYKLGCKDLGHFNGPGFLICSTKNDIMKCIMGNYGNS